MEKAVRTTCPYCGVGCGVSATLTAARTVTIKGDEAHPANSGRLCSKGTHLGETVGLEGRLLYPEIAGERVAWDTAIAHVAARFADTIAEHGPDSVAFYVSGQLLTEDYYVANKLMKGFIGTANIDTNSRLCMASAVAAHNRAFGEDVVPCSYSDLDEAELIVLVGSNTAWCHPIVWQRIEAARAARGTKLVVIDPRRTETAERADLHLAICPDGDVALFNRLLAAMQARGALDADYMGARVATPDGFWEGLDAGGDDGLDDATRDAFFARSRAVPLREAAGEISADLIIPYPPGIPVIAPGDVIETIDSRPVAEVARAILQGTSAGAHSRPWLARNALLQGEGTASRLGLRRGASVREVVVSYPGGEAVRVLPPQPDGEDRRVPHRPPGVRGEPVGE